MTDSAELRAAAAEDSGRTCPYCRFAIKPGLDVAICASCRAVHHAECWQDNGGCSIVGCVGPRVLSPSLEVPHRAASATAIHQQSGHVPQTVPPAAQNGSFATTQMKPVESPPIAPEMALAPPPRRAYYRVLALITFAVAIAAGAFAATLAMSSESATSAASRAPVTTVHEVSQPASPTRSQQPAPPRVVNVAAAQRAVVSLLHSYAQAASEHNLGLLGSVLAESVTRTGAAYGSATCTTSTGKGAVLAIYQDQFTRTTGQYQLTDLSPAAIAVRGNTAIAPLHYLWVFANSTGSITFSLGNTNGGWRITHISAVCS